VRRLRAAGDEQAATVVEAADLARRSLDEEGFYRDGLRLLEASYLRESTPRGGSGFGGTAAEWRARRSQICEAIDRDGSFLDVGCANGHLMETMVTWCAERGIRLEPHGIDLSARLVAEARRRLPLTVVSSTGAVGQRVSTLTSMARAGGDGTRMIWEGSPCAACWQSSRPSCYAATSSTSRSAS
jgi:2-polyprenyl-3-methyl-5-hydroxy-6-metoxy-1,4-benzoquinol methylase